eukprot:TRINITY_DN11918_c0_g1_i1.p6 TRINITY_DN11918_c0_g1~~TRINITY_DN11918_c0_g1_i1.p6  ORF type:complete len:222 (+),score=76.00 TRINITY_DN11918_c0_g1_i1:175-840(+)
MRVALRPGGRAVARTTALQLAASLGLAPEPAPVPPLRLHADHDALADLLATARVLQHAAAECDLAQQPAAQAAAELASIAATERAADAVRDLASHGAWVDAQRSAVVALLQQQYAPPVLGTSAAVPGVAAHLPVDFASQRALVELLGRMRDALGCAPPLAETLRGVPGVTVAAMDRAAAAATQAAVAQQQQQALEQLDTALRERCAAAGSLQTHDDSLATL